LLDETAVIDTRPPAYQLGSGLVNTEAGEEGGRRSKTIGLFDVIMEPSGQMMVENSDGEGPTAAAEGTCEPTGDITAADITAKLVEVSDNES